MKRLVFCVVFAALSMVPSAAFAQYSDTTAPALVTLTFSPSAIDTSASDQTVTVTMDVTDDLSGFGYGYIYFQSPSRQEVYGYIGTLVSGDRLNGRFRATVTFPMFSEAGTWQVRNLYLYDQAGNSAVWQAAGLQAAGFPSTVAVTSVPDVTAPTLVSSAVNPSSIDVSSGPQDVTFTLRITDDISGFADVASRGGYSLVFVNSPSGRQQTWTLYDDVRRVSGTAQDGVYEASVRFPRYSEPGNWRPSLYLYDRAGNQRSVSSSTTVTVTSSPADTTAPQLNSLSFSPAFINTSTGYQYVDVTFDLRDDLAGIRPRTLGNYSWCFGALSFQSPSGGQTRGACLSRDSQLIAGTPLNGTWRTQVYFPRYSEAGTWRVSYCYLYDGTWNRRYLNTADLVAAGLPTELVVILPSLGVDGTAGPGGGTVQDSVFGSRAQITAPPGTFPVNTAVSIDVLQSPPDIPSPQGFGAAGSRFVNIELDPRPSFPLPAPGLTITIPIVESNPPLPGTTLNLFRVNSATGTLIPAFGAGGLPIAGTVSADGRSATFTGIISLSTIVALARTSQVPGDLDGDGRVDCADVQVVKAAFGKRSGQPGYDVRADVNRNGVVDINDLAYVSRLLPLGTRCQ